MKIICFGDSLTRGVTYVKGRVRILKGNYPALLRKMFDADKLEDVEIINKGVFNDNSHLLMKRLEKDVLLQKPDYVLINIGGNDCNFNWLEVVDEPNHTHMPIVSINDYVENIRTMVSKLKEANITPVFLTLPPLDPVNYYKNLANQNGTSISHWICLCGGMENWHSLYNRNLVEVIQQLEIDCIDIRTELTKLDDYKKLLSEDGIHLNQEGYDELGAIIYRKLREKMKMT